MSESPSIDPRPASPPPGAPGADGEREQPVVRDKRRIDPVTGRLREPSAAPGGAAGSAPPAPGAPGAPGSDAAAAAASAPADVPAPAGEQAGDSDAERVALQARVAELTSDLQRLSAEYANYRRRVERDREATAVAAAASVLSGLVPVLDDIERARVHGDLEGSFRAVGEAVEKVATALGLTAYGAQGEPFDPTLHEALVSQPSPDVTEPSVAEVFARGYRIGDRVLRAAQVVVAEPA